MPQRVEIVPVTRPVCGEMAPPGSKSLTNRALIVAALAEGASRLTGVLDSQDTRVMLESLRRLGLTLSHDPQRCTVDITGCGGTIPVREADLWLENSGTSIRFLTALCALGKGRYRLDGNARMRARPIGDLVEGLAALGPRITFELAAGFPPVRVEGDGLVGGTARVAGNVSSQFLSALLMVAPKALGPLLIEQTETLVSEPYVEMTLAVMEAFGVRPVSRGNGRFAFEPSGYQGRAYAIEPDASAASYLFAIAAITGGSVTVNGLRRDALQGDVKFVDVLRQMGCQVSESATGLTVTGGPLRGVDVDMNAISDTAQTLAAVAVFAKGPTRVRNVAHMRHKETDRVSAVVTELRKLGQHVEEHPDGYTITPSAIQPAAIETYDDHRMAMSFALIGLRSPGVVILDPVCTRKTYPNYFEDLARLCETNLRFD